MSTIINTPPSTVQSDNGAGWVVAVIILVAAIGAGAYLWVHYGYNTSPATNGATNINVTIPGTPPQANTSAPQKTSPY